MIKTNCLVCNNEFFTFQSIKNSGNGKFCSKKCYFLSKKGKTPWNKGTKGICKPNSGSFKEGLKGKFSFRWKGGKSKQTSGYRLIYFPEHPNAMRQYVFEHRLIVEKKIGRILKKKEIVHHINGKKDDNRIENLYLCSDSFHRRYHRLKNKPILFSNLI